jgi:hypothetical protein
VGDPVQPAAGIFGEALGLPALERRRERALDGVLGEREVLEARDAGKRRDQRAVLVPKEMFGEVAQRPASSRISMRVPGPIIPNISRAISSAAS